MADYIPLAQAMKQLNGDIIIEVVSIGDLKAGTGSKGDWTKKVATIKDESAEMKLTLWNTDIEKIQQGKFYKIENPFWTTYEEKPQLSLGQYFKLFETTKEKLLRNPGTVSSETVSQEKQEVEKTPQEIDYIAMAKQFIKGEKLTELELRTSITWAREILIRNWLKTKEGKDPDNSRVGMYVKLHADWTQQ